MTIKMITNEEYLDKAQNGARTLFDYHDFRLVDGDKYFDDDTEVTSYFLMDFGNNEDGELYELSADVAFNLLAMKHLESEYLFEEITDLVLSLSQ